MEFSKLLLYCEGPKSQQDVILAGRQEFWESKREMSPLVFCEF